MIKDYTSSANNMDTHKYREITGVDSNEGNTNSNHPHQHDTINDDETTGVEIQNHNDDKITGVATQEDDEVTGVAIHNHDEEGRYVMVTHIPGTFLHTDMKGTVHMVLEGTIFKLIIKLELTIYRKYVWHYKKGKPMLYIQLKKGPIWYATGSSSVLGTVIKYINRLGIHNQPI
jgi:hypothetical protein